MNVDQKTLADLIAEIAPKRLEPGDLTVSMLAEEYDFNRKTIQQMLDRLVEEGKAERFWGFGENNRKCWIYRKIT